MKTFVLLDATNNVVNTIIADTQEIANQCVTETITSALLIPEGSSYVDGSIVENPKVEVPVTVSTIISKYEFSKRFTQAERIAIRNSTDDIVIDFRTLLDMAQNVDLSDAELIAGVNYLKDINLLTVDRVNVILNK